MTSDGNSYFASGFVLCDNPDVVLNVIAAINAPTVMGICDDLALDGGNSEGGGGRSLIYR